MSFTFTTLDVPGANETEARGVNNNGVVVGAFQTGSGDFTTFHGFIFQNGSFTTLDFPSAPQTFVNGISSSGVVVGSYDNVSQNMTSSFMFQNGQFTNIDCAPGSSFNTIVAAGINDSGVVVEALSNSFKIGTEIMLRSPDGRCQQVPVGSDMPQAFAQGINNNEDLTARVVSSQGILENAAVRIHGTWTRVNLVLIGGINITDDVVGDSDSAGRNGVLLKGGNATAVMFPGSTFTSPAGLNDKDVVVGNYSTNTVDSNAHGFIATPK